MSKELSTEKRMTVKELASVLNVGESTVKNYALKLRQDLSGVKNRQGGYLFNEKDVTLIKLSLEKNQHLAKDDLDNVVELPKTELEKELLIKQAMVFQNEKIINLQNEVSILKPKADLADKAIRDETTQYSIRDAGKHIGLKQKEIFSIMRDKKLLTTKNQPTQKALNYKVLSQRTNIIDGKNYKQAVMTMENINEFNRRYNKA